MNDKIKQMILEKVNGFLHNSSLIEKIQKIHNDSYIFNNTLYLKGEIEGKNLEKINELWNGYIHCETIISIYNHPKEIPLIINHNNHNVNGDLSNVQINHNHGKINGKTNSESILDYCDLRKKIIPFHKNISIKNNTIYLNGDISKENLEKIKKLFTDTTSYPVYNHLEKIDSIIIIINKL